MNQSMVLLKEIAITIEKSMASIISVVNILYFLFFIGWWIKRASYPEDRETTCVIWRLKFGKFTKSVITKLSNLLNKEL